MIPDRAIISLCGAFDASRHAFSLGRDRAEVDRLLRETLDEADALEADDINNLAVVTCPVAIWNAARAIMREWLMSHGDIRRGRLGVLADEAVAVLLAYQTGSIERPYPNEHKRILVGHQRAAGDAE